MQKAWETCSSKKVRFSERSQSGLVSFEKISKTFLVTLRANWFVKTLSKNKYLFLRSKNESHMLCALKGISMIGSDTYLMHGPIEFIFV